jgi:hypothetical protein
LRQAGTSPMRVCTPRKSLVRVISTALVSRPAMNSSLTAWMRDGGDIERLGPGFGISRTTSYIRHAEALQVLTGKARPVRPRRSSARSATGYPT